VRLYPLFHPAAALYTRSLLDTLRADFGRLPELLELALPEQPVHAEPEPAVPEADVAAAAPEPAAMTAAAREPGPEPERPDDRQLGLF
jgi:uracil-DNA glycosylase